MDIARKHDAKVIEAGLKSADPNERHQARKAADRIKREQGDHWTREARERLITETLKGNTDNATQIRDDMVRHRGGRLGPENHGEILSASFNYAPGEYERIFGHK